MISVCVRLYKIPLSAIISLKLIHFCSLLYLLCYFYGQESEQKKVMQLILCSLENQLHTIHYCNIALKKASAPVVFNTSLSPPLRSQRWSSSQSCSFPGRKPRHPEVWAAQTPNQPGCSAPAPAPREAPSQGLYKSHQPCGQIHILRSSFAKLRRLEIIQSLSWYWFGLIHTRRLSSYEHVLFPCTTPAILHSKRRARVRRIAVLPYCSVWRTKLSPSPSVASPPWGRKRMYTQPGSLHRSALGSSPVEDSSAPERLSCYPWEITRSSWYFYGQGTETDYNTFLINPRILGAQYYIGKTWLYTLFSTGQNLKNSNQVRLAPNASIRASPPVTFRARPFCATILWIYSMVW